MKPELHWSEQVQARHDMRQAFDQNLARNLIFRDMAIQARKRFEFQERIAGRWP
jgi:hypothetical protein